MQHEIRAAYDNATITVYQAYSPAIAGPALVAGTFVPPFSFTRMTWIKPSFLWLMHRSNWAQKPGQERILAVRMTRAGFDAALAEAVPTTGAHAGARVHVQWDPERSLRGAALNVYSIQVGIGRALIRTLVDEWIVSLTDVTPLAVKINSLVRAGRAPQAQRLLPPDRVYQPSLKISSR
ncbi:DUF4291 domain-containing protein [Catenuloplanes japonicus]|uniref:DUF4291 domain-containing protein n=1 Tax=Catenuloplanes japonicus TaxID=33876 RepID=UPI0005256C45|nr:DUF4291 domain-containing protein [Catenuloplanes japonicus]